MGTNYRCYWIFNFTKLTLHHPRAATAASRGSTVADLALRTTRHLEPYILWSRFTHTLPGHTLISTVWTLVCGTTPPDRSPVKSLTVLNEFVTAVSASRFSTIVVCFLNTYPGAKTSCLFALWACHIVKCALCKHSWYKTLLEIKAAY